MNNKIDLTSLNNNTLAHELVAREEQNIAIFFISFAIQLYLTKEMLKKDLNKPKFLLYYGDIELFASQRVLIKNIILNKDYKGFCEDIEKFLIESNIKENLPHECFFNKINKSFLIRQIFNQTDQVLSKYKFINKFINLNITELDLSELFSLMVELPREQQILIISRIFSNIHDRFENKKKSIQWSFLENLERKKSEYVLRKKDTSQELINIKMLINVVKEK
jgi:hypothetical protein